LPKTPDTVGLFDRELLAHAKPGVRIVNAARGGIVDEDALVEAIRAGRVGGAAIDVFSTEPTTDSPLFSLPSVVVTPHLGASTNEAQDKAGEQIAEQIVLALAGDFVPYAVNVEAGAVSETVRPFLGISEILGRFIASLSGGLPDGLTVECQGALASEDVSILTLAVLKGLFATVTEDPISYVNARRVAEERGLVVHESQTASSPFRVSVVTVRSSRHSISGTLVAGAPRIVEVDAHAVEIPPADVMVVVHNDDRPGMIGIVGTALGDAGISIVNMAVGQTAGGKTALMVLATDRSVPVAVLDELRRASGILEVYEVTTV